MGDNVTWREPSLMWALLLLAGAILAIAFASEMDTLYNAWQTQEEYSHGFLIPFIALFLIYQKKDQLEKIPFSGSWIGVAIVVFGALLHLAGRLAAADCPGNSPFAALHPKHAGP